MKVLCTQNDLSAICDLTGKNISPKRYSHIQIGQEFTVLGMHFKSKPIISEESAWVYIQFDDLPRMTFAPLSLFRITDDRISRHWLVTRNNGGVVFFEHRFFRKYPDAFEDLEEDHPPEGIVEDFLKMTKELKNEFEGDRARSGGADGEGKC